MAITSKGYAGSIDYGDWAEVAAHMGGTYSVFGSAAFAIAAGPGDRQVVITPGRAAGSGILDDSDSSESVFGSAVLSGSRWDMVALRRNWTAPAHSELVLIEGGSTKVIPEDREQTPGTLDDQPLWLVRFDAGQTAFQELVDLRVWRGDSGLVANDLMVRDFMNRIGTSIRVGAEQWVRTIDAGNPVWRDVANWSAVNGRPTEFPPATHALDAHSGVLSMGRGGTGKQTRNDALAALGVFAWDADSVTVPANGSRVFEFTIPVGYGTAQDYAVVPTVHTRALKVQWGRTGQVIRVTVYNDTNSADTAVIGVIAARKYIYPGGSA